MFKTPLLLISISASLIAVSTSALGADMFRVDQGWTQQDRDTMYTISEGSELMPLQWFLHLEDAKSQTKLNKKLTSYGFVYDGKTDLKKNPYKLPIGLVTHDDAQTQHLYGELKWIGVNCTACHTGQISINGKNLLIDGGASLFRIQNFEKDIVSSVKATLEDTEKLNRFFSATATAENKRTEVKNNLALFLKEFGGWVQRNHQYLDRNGKEIFYGPGRIDGLGGPTNDLTCHLTDRMGDTALNASVTDSRNCQASHPAVSLPHLWGMVDAEWVQWNGGVHVALARNFGQSTGTYGKNWMEYNALGLPMIKSTAKVAELLKIENYYKKLKTPLWDDLVAQGLVAKLNPEKVKRGQLLYNQNCASCHAVQPDFSFPNLAGNRYWETGVYSAEELGVDATYLEFNRKRRSVVPAQVRPEFQILFRDDIAEDGTTSAAKLRAFGILKASTLAFLVQKYPNQTPTLTNLLNPLSWANPVDVAEFTSCRNILQRQSKEGFKARSLEGVGFTAPYLHNGSVPTLDDLLKPQNERPVTFYVGCNKYSTEKMGYECSEKDAGVELFDTRLESNHNTGHEYGYLLNAGQRADLIEFMKSLKNPEKPWRPTNCY